MNRNYIILAAIAIVLAIGILLMGNNEPQGNKAGTAEDVSIRQSRFVSVDQVTNRLIQEDPSIVLIDVRPSEQFKKFAIPGALNIPLDSLLTPSSLEFFSRKGMDKVLYSNADIWSNHAWLMLQKHKITSIFVLQGGANEWYSSILQSKEPPATAPIESQNTYSFHQAAYQHFYGSPLASTANGQLNTSTPKPSKSVQVIRQQPSASSGGGC
ncbi:MAG: rhodanese-like domain-containing protein [Omnitrophica WOR_2 bacterium]